jgi:hypothetical protein
MAEGHDGGECAEPALLVHPATRLSFGFVRPPGDTSDRSVNIRCLPGTVPGNAEMSLVGVVHYDGRVTIEPTVKQRIEQLRMLKANQSEDWLFTWGHVIDGAIAALVGRGRRRKVDKALEYYDSEVARGRSVTRELVHEACEIAGCEVDTLKGALRKRARD